MAVMQRANGESAGTAETCARMSIDDAEGTVTLKGYGLLSIHVPVTTKFTCQELRLEGTAKLCPVTLTGICLLVIRGAKPPRKVGVAAEAQEGLNCAAWTPLRYTVTVHELMATSYGAATVNVEPSVADVPGNSPEPLPFQDIVKLHGTLLAAGPGKFAFPDKVRPRPPLVGPPANAIATELPPEQLSLTVPEVSALNDNAGFPAWATATAIRASGPTRKARRCEFWLRNDFA
jgi:hypothetical protein